MELQEFRRKEWGIERILFGVSPPSRRDLEKVFTGREGELETTQVAVYETPRRVLISGLFGVGKTTFIKELLAQLNKRYKSKVLTVYASVSIGSSDLETTILQALARMLRDEDEEAKELDAALRGLQTTKRKQEEIESGINAAIRATGTLTEATTQAFKSVTNPGYHIERLIQRAVRRKPDRRLVVAIDDLDKRDPATIRQSLQAARGVLHLECSYLLTAHPLGVLRDIYSTPGGVFDKQVDLRLFTPDELLEMIEKYLAAGQVEGVRRVPYAPFTEEVANLIVHYSFGLPRVLNYICLHILEEAGRRRLKKIGIPEFQECHRTVRDHLLRGVEPDLRNLIEILQEYPEGFVPSNVPDAIFSRLNVDSTLELIAKLEQAVRSDWVIMDEHGRYRPQFLVSSPPALL